MRRDSQFAKSSLNAKLAIRSEERRVGKECRSRLHRKLKVNRIVSSSIAAGFGMFTNTLLVIGSLYLLYGQGVTGILGAGFVVALGAIFLSNGLLELAVAAIIIPIIYSAYSRYNKIK
mgnify:CR=1 FL=1